MIVYNLTIRVEPAIEAEWVRWQKDEHIPEVMSSGQFTDYKFYRLLDQDESDGITYVVQYFATDIHHYNKYIDSFAPGLRKKALNKWGDKFIAFRTVMQIVH
ncbi:MAG TPA: DUF4286 family protein [Chitinophagaceae bacterium]|nr:DUF4286 family protein [Chitinophagaceae bacterium]